MIILQESGIVSLFDKETLEFYKEIEEISDGIYLHYFDRIDKLFIFTKNYEIYRYSI